MLTRSLQTAEEAEAEEEEHQEKVGHLPFRCRPRSLVLRRPTNKTPRRLTKPLLLPMASRLKSRAEATFVMDSKTRTVLPSRRVRLERWRSESRWTLMVGDNEQANCKERKHRNQMQMQQIEMMRMIDIIIAIYASCLIQSVNETLHSLSAPIDTRCGNVGSI